MALAPWLVPPNFLDAIRSGAGTGLQARGEDLRQREQDIQQAQAADRLQLAYDTLAQQERVRSKEAAEKLALAKATLALRGSQADLLNQYRMKMLQDREARGSALDLYRQQRFGEQEKMFGQRQDLAERGLGLRKAALDLQDERAKKVTPQIRTLPGGEIVERQPNGTWKTVPIEELPPPKEEPGWWATHMPSWLGGAASTNQAPAAVESAGPGGR